MSICGSKFCSAKIDELEKHLNWVREEWNASIKLHNEYLEASERELNGRINALKVQLTQVLEREAKLRETLSLARTCLDPYTNSWVLDKVDAVLEVKS